MLCFYVTSTDAPAPAAAAAAAAVGRVTHFKPGITVIVAILITVFSLTFFLLMYMKHCKRPEDGGGVRYYYSGTAAGGRGSGVDRKVVISLPMFRFSSLTGHKDGLECAVCLNRFEPAEVLRLLPKCKHAFHVECVDTWLDAHSTCPLCRYRVDPEDVLLVDGRVSGRRSSTAEENPERHDFRCRKDGQLPVQTNSHRLEHRIIVSEEEERQRRRRRRWSDAQAAEFLYLRSEEMMGYRHSSDGRDKINARSLSEITGLSRYEMEISNNSNNINIDNRNSVVRRWLRRWLDWISQSQTTAGPSSSSSSMVV